MAWFGCTACASGSPHNRDRHSCSMPALSQRGAQRGAPWASRSQSRAASAQAWSAAQPPGRAPGCPAAGAGTPALQWTAPSCPGPAPGKQGLRLPLTSVSAVRLRQHPLAQEQPRLCRQQLEQRAEHGLSHIWTGTLSRVADQRWFGVHTISSPRMQLRLMRRFCIIHCRLTTCRSPRHAYAHHCDVMMANNKDQT